MGLVGSNIFGHETLAEIRVNAAQDLGDRRGETNFSCEMLHCGLAIRRSIIQKIDQNQIFLMFIMKEIWNVFFEKILNWILRRR